MEITKIVLIVWIFIAIAAVESQKRNNCKRQKSIPADHTCRKACKTKKDCRGANKKCACDGICGLSCFNPDAECPSEKDPFHGTVQHDKLAYGGYLTYTCDAGYKLQGIRKRRCGSDKKWSGKAPKCVQVVSCQKRPEDIENGFRRISKSESEAVYSCATGYSLKGQRTRNCQKNGTWSGSPPVCVQSGCRHPPRLGEAFAVFPVTKTKFEVGDQIRYKCRFGFTLDGNPNVTCTQQYTWSPAKFQCAKVSCGEPQNIENSHYEAKDFLFGTWVTYKCNEGYLLEDPRISRRYCATSGAWSGKAPACKIKFCPPPSAPPNGNVVARSNKFNSLAEYTCNQGYKLNGDREGRCQDDETWGELPICEVDIQCTFENPAQPTCGYKNPGRGKWKRLYVPRDRNGLPTYAMKYDGDSVSTILRSPVIPDKKPHCLQFYFKPEDTLQSVNYLTVEVNGVRTKRAAPSDDIVLPTNRWIGLQATMQTEKSSFQFDVIAKGHNIVYVDDFKVKKGKCESPCKVENRCENGAVCVDEIETSYCSCTEGFTGKFCDREITCNVPAIRNGRVAGDNPLAFGSKAYFDCDSGYELRGASVATCTGSGLSPKEAATCIEIIKYSGECPSGFLPFQLMCYRIFKNPQTYENAKRTCAKYGANLATVQSSLVNKFIKKNSPHTPLQYFIWIGLRSIDNRRTWESGVKYEGTQGVENNLRDGSANYCAAYEYKFWNLFRWRITYLSCRRSEMFVCETWKSSAKSYTVRTQWSFSGVYRPVNGLLTSSGRQVFYSTQSTSYLYHTYDQVSGLEGWFIGNYNIRGASAGDWYVVASGSHAMYPDKIGKWRNRNNWNVQIASNENNWWNNWSLFQCDVTCGQGMQTRRRRCSDGVPGNMECRGPDIDLQTCTLPICRDDKSIDSHIYKGKTYLFFPDRLPWQQASQACLINNMELATITNRQLAAMLSSKMRTIDAQSNLNENFWVNGRENSDQWCYADGRTMVQQDEAGDLWNQGEPNGPDQSDCIELSQRGGLNDHQCVTRRRYICQEATVKNPCDRKPCRGIRLCVPLRGGYRCDCPIGTVEPLCTVPEPTLASNAQDLGSCSSDPCFGDAICRPALDSAEPSGFQCFCKSGWQGRLCDKERKDGLSTSQFVVSVKPTASRSNQCERKPCKNNGKCVIKSQGYRCECLNGYGGPNCEKDSSISAKTTKSPAEDPCKPDPCNGGGSCKPSDKTADGFLCFCRIERKGIYCKTQHKCKYESIPEHVVLYRAGTTEKLDSTKSILEEQMFDLHCTGGGVVLGEQTIKCKKTNQWSRHTRIYCVDKETVCQLDSVKNDVFEVFFDDGAKVETFPVSIESGSSLSFKCEIDGTVQSTTVTCEKGDWKTPIPSKCVSVTCSDVVAPVHGSVSAKPPNSTQPYEPGTRLTFRCDSYYVIKGSTSVTCGKDGSWSTTLPTCEESGCFLFSFDLNPDAFVKNFEFEDITAKHGDKFQLRCKNKPNKKQTVTCMGKDVWKPPLKDFKCN